MDILTFLSSPSTIATKIWSPDPDGKPHCSDYQIPLGPFAVQRAPVSSLASLLGVLTLCPSNAFHVRGRPIGDVQTIPYRRKNHHPGEPPSLEAEAHRTVPVDWDGEDAAPMRDLEAAARGVRAQLPAPFSTAECIAQATSSAGMKPGTRVRLVFFADRPVTDAEAASYFEHIPEVDTSIYQAAQPIYVAPPRFQGLPDPVPTRWLLLEGEPLVLPTPESAAALAGAQTAAKALQGLGAATVPGQAVQAGGRNNALTSQAGSMRARGFSEAAIDGALQIYNREHCQPPLPEADVSNIARSVAQYEPTAIPVVAKVSSVAAEKALRKQLDRLKHDPGLLSDAAAHLKQHLLDGTLTETEVQSRISKATKEVHTPVQIIDALRAAPVLANTRGHAEWQLNLKMNAEGGITPGPDNQMRIFRDHPQVSLWYDTRAERPVWQSCPWGAAPRFYNADADGAHARVWLENSVGWIAAPRDPHETIHAVARDKPIDPFAAWLHTLVWDGVERLSSVAPQILGAHEHVEAVTFSWWLISSVARTFDPGCQVDHMIVLEGEQGASKTSFLRALATQSRYYDRLASTGDLTNPRVVAKLQGPVIIELAELAVLSKRAAESTKEFLDGRIDVWTPLYAHDIRTSPRKVVFAGTTNSDDYLNDPTGARRFWPIHCADELLVSDMVPHVPQLWAEAVAAYRAGARWWPTRAEAEELGLRKRTEERRAAEFAEEEVAGLLSADRVWTPVDPALPPNEQRFRPTGGVVTAGPPAEPWQIVDGQLTHLATAWLAQCAGVNAIEKAHQLGRTLRTLGWRRGNTRFGDQVRKTWVRK